MKRADIINIELARFFYFKFCRLEIILLLYDYEIMTLQINLGQSDVTLKLLKNGAALDLQEAKYYHDLSEVLISALDKLLKRNKIDATALKSFKIKGNLGLGKDSTSYKIATAFIEGLKI